MDVFLEGLHLYKHLQSSVELCFYVGYKDLFYKNVGGLGFMVLYKVVKLT